MVFKQSRMKKERNCLFVCFFFFTFLITFIAYNTSNDNTYIYMEEK